MSYERELYRRKKREEEEEEKPYSEVESFNKILSDEPEHSFSFQSDDTSNVEISVSHPLTRENIAELETLPIIYKSNPMHNVKRHPETQPTTLTSHPIVSSFNASHSPYIKTHINPYHKEQGTLSKELMDKVNALSDAACKYGPSLRPPSTRKYKTGGNYSFYTNKTLNKYGVYFDQLLEDNLSDNDFIALLGNISEKDNEKFRKSIKKPNPSKYFYARQRARKWKNKKNRSFDRIPKPSSNKANYIGSQLNNFFSSKPRDAYLSIVGRLGKDKCSLSETEIINHYKCIWNKHTSFDVAFTQINGIWDDKLFEPIIASEVKYVLKNISSKSSTGPDNITNHTLKALINHPRGAICLAKRFTRWLTELNIPESLKLSQTILIPKKPNSDGRNISHFRPISLTSCLYRLFTSCVNLRLKFIIEKIIDKSQVGFMPKDGCLINLETFEAISRKLNSENRTGNALFTDLTKAFDLIERRALLDTINHKLGTKFATFVKNIYTNANTFFYNSSNTICLTNGVRQGCPLSPLLFNLSINEFIVKLNATNKCGISIETPFKKFSCKVLAYADDLLLLNENLKGTREAINILELWCTKFGMSINTAKCGIIQIGYKPVEISIKINDEKVPSISDSYAYTYLGIKQSHLKSLLLTHTEDHFNEVANDWDCIINSKLSCQNKLISLRKFILPAVSHIVRLGKCNKYMLNQFITHIRKGIRDILFLPANASTPWIHSAINNGGLGIVDLHYEFDIMHIFKFIQLVNSPSLILKALTIMRAYRCRGCYSEIPSCLKGITFESSLINILKHTPNVPAYSFFWKQPFKWYISNGHSFCFEEGILKLKLKSDNNETFICNSRKEIRSFLKEKRLNEWANEKIQGRLVASLKKAKVSHYFIWGQCESLLLKWVIAARLDLLCNLRSVNTRSNKSKKTSSLCRACRLYDETLCHILNGCNSTRDLQRKRHNDIVNIIRKASNLPNDTIVKVDSVFDYEKKILRPDLVFLQGYGLSDLLIDVSVSFDDPKNMEYAYEKKTKKYEILKQINLDRRHVSLEILPFVVGSLGSVPISQDRIFYALSINDKSKTKIQKKIVITVLRWSKFIYDWFIRKVENGEESPDYDFSELNRYLEHDEPLYEDDRVSEECVSFKPDNNPDLAFEKKVEIDDTGCEKGDGSKDQASVTTQKRRGPRGKYKKSYHLSKIATSTQEESEYLQKMDAYESSPDVIWMG